MERRRWLLLCAVAATACRSGTDGGVCTALFAYITAVVVDAGGHAVSAVSIADSVLRTGHRFTVLQEAAFPAGTVDIFSDTQIGEVRETGDAVQVTGILAGQRFSAGYTFGSDGCHVRKITGPDTLVVQ